MVWTARVVNNLRKLRVLRGLVGVLVLLLAASWTMGCSVSNEQLGSKPLPRADGQKCAGLEDRLQQMTGASDPARFAQEQKVYYQGGLVRVAIELSSSDAQLPSGYGVQLEGRVQGLVQALVPLGELCKLSNEPQVRSIMVPSEVRPLGK